MLALVVQDQISYATKHIWLPGKQQSSQILPFSENAAKLTTGSQSFCVTTEMQKAGRGTST